nr:hypothetical protein [Tanacetum cinerariifolium]
MGGRSSRGGGRTRGRFGGQDDGRNDGLGGQVGDDRNGCTYKEFLACNPKEYDGMSWEDFRTLTREEFCPSYEMKKLETELWNHAMVGAVHAAYTDRFHELVRLPDRTPRKEKMGDNLVRIGMKGMITKGLEWEMLLLRSQTLLGEVTRDCRVVPRNVNPTNARNPVARTCFECGSTDHIKSACPRLNQAQRPGGNQQNQDVAVNGGQGLGKQGNQVRRRAFMLEAKEALQDPNIMTGTFTLNDHYATTLFDSGADYSFVSTTFLPLLDIEPIDIGMDWFSDHKAEIIYHEKVVRIPLLDDKVLRVPGEKPEEKMRQFMSVKAKEKEQEEIVVVRDFLEVFPEDLSGLPPVPEIKF